jgi:AbrB family looped-hinge helix DNA binding protein
MKKHPKILQCDKRGQIVIPKEIRQELGLDESSGFYMYAIQGEGILLKKIESQTLEDNQHILDEISEKATKINVNTKNLETAKKQYQKTKDGNLDIL